MIGELLARAIVVVIVVIWVATTLVLPIAVRGYTPPPEVGTVMGVVAGGAVAVLFARSRNGKNGNGNGNGNGNDKIGPTEES